MKSAHSHIKECFVFTQMVDAKQTAESSNRYLKQLDFTVLFEAHIRQYPVTRNVVLCTSPEYKQKVNNLEGGS